MGMNDTADLVDELVALYAERVARGEATRADELIARAPLHRAELLRCFRMLDGAPSNGPAALANDVQLGDFRVVRELGRGGMAVVYEAEQLSLRRRVALKVLRNHLTLEPRHVERFQREARAAAKLAHANVAAVHAVGTHDGHAFIAFELVRGPSLAALIATLRGLRKRPTAADLARASANAELALCPDYTAACARLVHGVFDAVAFAHASGVIHRDIKPSNILLDSAGKALVADFGLAKDMGEASLSLSGETLGTPHYMSPEQAGALASRVDERTDVYSLGVTLYELLTLTRPFEGDTLQQLVLNISTLEVAHPSELAPDVARRVGDVVLKSLAKDPAQRYASVNAFQHDLELALIGAQTNAVSSRGLSSVLGRWFDARAHGVPFEYRSRAHIFGLPLLHIADGVRDARTRQPKWARGVVAIGDFAIGGYAAGKFAVGLIAFGGIAVGAAGIGALAAAYAAIGGLAVGVDVTGLIAAGQEGVGLLAESVAVQRSVESLRFDSPSRSGPSHALLTSLVSALLMLTLVHGVWRRRATTRAHARLVNLATRVVLPLLCCVPGALDLAGVEVGYMAALAYVAAVALAASFVLRAALRNAAPRR